MANNRSIAADDDASTCFWLLCSAFFCRFSSCTLEACLFPLRQFAALHLEVRLTKGNIKWCVPSQHLEGHE